MSEKPNVTQITDQDQALRLWLHQNMMCLARGSLSCFASLPPEKVLVMICAVTGQLMAEMYAGDEIAVHRFRKACRDVFDGMTKQMPVVAYKSVKEKTDTADIGMSAG